MGRFRRVFEFTWRSSNPSRLDKRRSSISSSISFSCPKHCSITCLFASSVQITTVCIRLGVSTWHIFPSTRGEHVIPAIAPGGSVRANTTRRRRIMSEVVVRIVRPHRIPSNRLQRLVPRTLLDLIFVLVMKRHGLVRDEAGIFVVIPLMAFGCVRLPCQHVSASSRGPGQAGGLVCVCYLLVNCIHNISVGCNWVGSFHRSK